MDNFVDCWYHSDDGLRLYARDYACRDADRPDAETVLCMHGLTRNCADFADLAEHLCERYRVIAVDQRGRCRSEYDPAIATPMEQEGSGAIPPDMWPLFESVCDIPMLVVRGALSDILAVDCVEGMLRRKPDLQVAEIPDRGHAPTLTEAASLVAIDAFLGQL